MAYNGKQISAFLVLVCCLSNAVAETNYVTDELKIGLHKESSTDSPILKLIPSGTALDVLSREQELVRVTEPGGLSGWVHQRYLLETAPDRSRVLELQKQNSALSQQLQKLQAQPGTPAEAVDERNVKELEQKLNSERLKVGELQAQLADIKSNLNSIGTSSAAEQQLQELRQANSDLVAQLQANGIEVENAESGLVDYQNWKPIAISLLLLFIIGMVAGAYLLDYTNRRRHGGFRV